MGRYRTILPSGTGPNSPPSETDKAAGTLGQPEIRTELQAADRIYNSGPILMFGDTHGSPDGHQALVALMPTMQRAGVSTVAVELPTEFNDWMKGLQQDIKQKGLSEKLVQEALAAHLADNGITATGGEQATKDMGSLIYAATLHNMKVVGVDDRETDPAFADRLVAAANSGNADKFNNVLFSSDKNIAQRIASLQKNLPAGEKVAVVFGVEHSCGQEKQTRIINELGKLGYSINPIALDHDAHSLGAEYCQAPPTLWIDAPALVDQIHQRDLARNPETSSISGGTQNRQISSKAPSFLGQAPS